MAMRHRADERLPAAAIAEPRDYSIGGHDFVGVEHAHAVRAVAAVQHHGLGGPAGGDPLGQDEIVGPQRHGPVAWLARVWTGARLDAIHWAHPVGEAHVVRAVAPGALPRELGSAGERAGVDDAIGPAGAGTV